MRRMTAILDAQQGEQLKFDDLLATIAQEEGDDSCDVEQACHKLMNVNQGRKREFPYRCGWIGTDAVSCCPRRRRLLAK